MPPKLGVGCGLEVQLEDGSPWVYMKVVNVLDDNQYLLRWLGEDDEEDEHEAMSDDDGQAASDEAGDSALGQAVDGGPRASEARAAPRNEQARQRLAYEVLVRIQSNSMLQIIGSDGGQYDEEASSHQWRPEATSHSEMVERAFQHMLLTRPTQGPAVMPRASVVGNLVGASFEELIKRAVANAEQAGSHEVTVEMVQAAIASMSGGHGSGRPPH